jgi:hypothetical protein
LAVEWQQLRNVQLKTTESGFQRILYLCRFLKALAIKTKNTVAQGVNYVILRRTKPWFWQLNTKFTGEACYNFTIEKSLFFIQCHQLSLMVIFFF